MRKFQLAAVAMAVFGVALLAGASTARAANTEKVTVKFPFEVSGVIMPAGTYVAVLDYANPGVIEIRSEDGRYSAFASVVDNETTGRMGRPDFVFARADNRYYLTKVNDGMGDVEQVVMSNTTAAQALHDIGHDLNPRNW